MTSVKGGHGYLICSRDRGDEFRIRIGYDIVKEILLLLGVRARALEVYLRHIHGAYVVERLGGWHIELFG